MKRTRKEFNVAKKKMKLLKSIHEEFIIEHGLTDIENPFKFLETLQKTLMSDKEARSAPINIELPTIEYILKRKTNIIINKSISKNLEFKYIDNSVVANLQHLNKPSGCC